MNLTPREKDKLLVAMAANVARRRLERGVKLNHPEAIALITDFVVEGARLKRRTVAEVEPGGALLACEMVVLGRAASGETFTNGLLLDSWSVRRTSRLAWTDTLRVEGQTPSGAGFGAANALATVIGVWDAPQPQFEKARALLEGAVDVRAGVTLVNGVMVARLLGEATMVRHAAIRFLTDFRGRRLPRVWHV